MIATHLILGGARCGKSRLAEQTARELFECSPGNSKLIYIATATADDKEMQKRIDHHQVRRDEQWQLIEQPIELATAIQQAPDGSTILIDCLTLWLSNCLHKDCWLEQRQQFLDAVLNCPSSVVMVSNEVGSGIVPMGELSRHFVDESGWLHQELAQISTHVTLVVAGLATHLKEPTAL